MRSGVLTGGEGRQEGGLNDQYEFEGAEQLRAQNVDDEQGGEGGHLGCERLEYVAQRMEAAADDAVAYREYDAGERQTGDEALGEAAGKEVARYAQQDGMRHRGEQQKHAEKEDYFDDYDAKGELLTEVLGTDRLWEYE